MTKRIYTVEQRNRKNEQARKWRLENKEKNSEGVKKSRNKKKDKARESIKKYQLLNKVKIEIYQKEYRRTHKEKIRESSAKYRKKNYIEFNKKVRECHRLQKIRDPLYKSRCAISKLVCVSITGNGYKKRSKTNEILGCTFSEFKKYIEDQFLDGMTWDNHGKWHLDHKIPCASALTYEELIKLNRYTNFQPLWAIDNMRKGGKINYYTCQDLEL